jgi:methyl-accepting chemotaxis protein
MSDLAQSIQRVTEIMAQITAAGHEQSQGIDQINQTVIQMDNVTQQNAALVEQAAAAAGALQEQAHNLSELVSVFKLDGAQNTAAWAANTSLKANTPLHIAHQVPH